MKNKGFTLIELLVVIAIIGILSSVVLASLNTARGKGSNAAIKSQLAAIRPQAEIFYDNYGSYGTSTTVAVVQGTTSAGCTGLSVGMFSFDPTIINQIKGVAASAGGTAGANVNCMVSPATTNTAWAVSALLKVQEGSYTAWCVDSSGASKGETSLAPVAGLCV
jgi:prepilin-type N-terminal cleavage/methylation domain-containing protein